MKRTLLITGLFIGIFFATNASADCNSSGRCEWDCAKTESDSCTAVYENNVLTITGDGEMADYSWYTTPWKSTIRGKVSSIVVGEGITKIGDTSFYDLGKQTIDVSLPSTLETIGSWAFRETYNAQITLPENLETINSGAFVGLTPRQIEIPSMVTSIGGFNFDNSGWDIVLNANNNLILDSSVVRGVGGNYNDITITCKGDMKVCANMSANLKNKMIELNKNFNLKDADGNTLINCNGTGCVEYTYDDSGNLLKQKKYDTQGLFVSAFAPNANGSYLYYDENDQPIRNSDGSYNLYDENGNFIGYKGKRIYTVEEAAAVTKPTGNTFKIRYR